MALQRELILLLFFIYYHTIKKSYMRIFITASPCGVIVAFNEIFQAESKMQCLGSLLKFMVNLPEEKQLRIRLHMYDNMCHLHPAARNLLKHKSSSMLKFYTENLKHAVDFFHHRGHVDPDCKKTVQPIHRAEGDGVHEAEQSSLRAKLHLAEQGKSIYLINFSNKLF